MTDHMDETTEGLLYKYDVKRVNDPDGKHDDCRYFVLDPQHDKHARAALRGYIESCADEYPALAHDLTLLTDAARAETVESKDQSEGREPLARPESGEATSQDSGTGGAEPPRDDQGEGVGPPQSTDFQSDAARAEVVASVLAALDEFRSVVRVSGRRGGKTATVELFEAVRAAVSDSGVEAHERRLRAEGAREALLAAADAVAAMPDVYENAGYGADDGRDAAAELLRDRADAIEGRA